MPNTPHPHHGENGDTSTSRVVGISAERSRFSSYLTLIPVLLISAGVGLVSAQSQIFPGLNLANLKASLVWESGSGSTIQSPCDLAGIEQGTTLDSCDLVLGLSCASDGTCQCSRGTWDGTRCQPPEPTPSLLVRVPETFNCGPRCSAQFDDTSVLYESSTSDCVVPIPDSVRYFPDCSCESVRHETYSDFSARCAQQTPVPSPLAVKGSSCPPSYCPSGNSCVCCNGAQTPDCAFSCPDKKSKPVADCVQCGKECVLNIDLRTCSCGAEPLDQGTKKKCENGAANPPDCTQCPLGLIGSVCASEPNACEQRSTGEVLSNCRCNAPVPKDATCPETPTPTPLSFSDQIDFAQPFRTARFNDTPPPTLFPVHVESEIGKAGYMDGKMIFATTVTMTNVSATPLMMQSLELDLETLFGTIPVVVLDLRAEGLTINEKFDGKREMNLLVEKRDEDKNDKYSNRLDVGAKAKIVFTISIASNARQVRWEAPLRLSAISDGEMMEFTPTSIVWGLRKLSSQSAPSGQGNPTTSPDAEAVEQFGLLAGEVFRDENANGKREATESGIEKVKIVITDHEGIQQILFTNEAGNYETVVAEGEVSVAVSSVNPALGKNYRLTTPSAYVETIIVANDIVRIDAVGVAS